MSKHKWHKEIKAWADGEKIQFNAGGKWYDLNEDDNPYWDSHYEFRIKPQPKEPVYLYVWENQSTGEYKLSGVKPHPLKEYVSQWKCIGKIKLEQDDE